MTAILVHLGGAGLAVVSFQQLSEPGPDASGPAPTYKVRLHKKLKGAGLSFVSNREAKEPNVGRYSGKGAISGTYKSDGGTVEVLIIAVNSSSMKNGLAADDLLETTGSRLNGEGTRKPQDFRRGGAKDPLRCAIHVDEGPGLDTTPFPVCAWDDNGSAALVFDFSESTIENDPLAYDLGELADQTARIRAAVREPVSGAVHEPASADS
ncbi:hypothetical protein [Streptomyces iconiensis]|uniref:Uncharacterized protein n=1 Tax=Streptomyces iconiensis TaxID=1384038 RepID=A0ABT7A636_9ACTN|nr:hypothetical protein [Streptomyces iconiensis]MDJ1136805.1 hypothetical protein [Streptomyces iconiensis]